MYFAGRIHRDISGGNILWFTNGNGNKRGILGDLEYSKRPSSFPPSPDPKTVCMIMVICFLSNPLAGYAILHGTRNHELLPAVSTPFGNA